MSEEHTWDAVLRPKLTPWIAVGAAIAMVAIHVVLGLLLTIKSSGVIFRPHDQVAFASFGLLLGAAILLFTRPRLRIGPAGMSVRNLFGDKLVPWAQVQGLSFQHGGRWARLQLPDDEYVPVMAIQSADKDRAIQAMDTARELIDKYTAGGADLG